MVKDLTLMPELSEAQRDLLNKKTPLRFVKNRPGPSGKMLSYVEVGYVVDQLNQLFNYRWDWEISSQGREGNQLWVMGKLTVHLSKDFSLVKSAYGGASVKGFDIGDDFKAAAADALKKAASLLGVAADIYWPNMDRLEDEGTEGQEPAFHGPKQDAINKMGEKVLCKECGRFYHDAQWPTCWKCKMKPGWYNDDILPKEESGEAVGEKLSSSEGIEPPSY